MKLESAFKEWEILHELEPCTPRSPPASSWVLLAAGLWLVAGYVPAAPGNATSGGTYPRDLQPWLRSSQIQNDNTNIVIALRRQRCF